MPTDGNVSEEFHEIFMKLEQELYNRWEIYKPVEDQRQRQKISIMT